MNQTLKELFLVLAIAWVVFAFARPLALLFASQDDFLRRRNTWYVVTIAAFLCPSFFVFCLVAIPFLVAAGRKDSNPSALYLILMYAVPAFSSRVPMVGISYLIDLDFQILLSFCVMAPAALRLLKSGRESVTRRSGALDICLLAYLALSSIYFILPEISRGVLMTRTFTDCLRRAFEAFFEIYVPYFVLSRSSSTRREIQDIFAAFCLSCAVMAAVGIFESAKHWLLYAEIRSHWGYEYNPYLLRGGDLRAMASTSHPLVLGYLLAVALGLWFSLKSHLHSKLSRNAVVALYLLGLFAAYSRGPWLGAVVIYFVYAALSRPAVSGLLKAISTFALVAVIVAASPLGDKIAKVIPFLGGTVDAQNIAYRQRLLGRAWEIIQNSPILGDQHALLKMEDLRAAGIIDLINGFIIILLSNGFLGLLLYLTFVMTGVFKAWTLCRESARVGVEFSGIGASLVACMLGVMVMTWVGGLIALMTCILVGLGSASARIGQQQRPIRHAPSDGAR